MENDKAVPFLARCGDTTPVDWGNLKRLLGAYFLWAVCFAGASQLLKRGLVTEGPLLWLVIAAPLLVSLVVIATFVRFLRQADELQRIVQLQALAVGFGGTFFAATGYRLFERIGATPADIGDLALVMAFFYSAAVVLGWSKYR